MDVDCPQMKRCIEIAQICVDGDQHNRPTIGEIIRMLNEAETMIHKVPAVISESTNDPGSSVYQVGSIIIEAKYVIVLFSCNIGDLSSA
jgi:hypothetical protein